MYSTASDQYCEICRMCSITTHRFASATVISCAVFAPPSGKILPSSVNFSEIERDCSPRNLFTSASGKLTVVCRARARKGW